MAVNIEGLFDKHEKMIRISSRGAYEKKMAEFEQTRAPHLQEYYNAFDFAQEKEQALKAASEQLACDVFEQFAKKGRMKMNRQGPLNLYMVFFVFPTILKERFEDGTQICDALKDAWNQQFTLTTIGYSDYETLRSGFKTSFLGIPIGRNKSDGR